MHAKKSMYMQMDTTWKIELGIADSLTEKGGDECMFKWISDALPSREHRLTMQQSAAKLDELALGPMYRFSAKSAQMNLDICREVLSDMLQGKEPRWKQLATSPFLSEFSRRLELFVTEDDFECNDEELGGVVVGAAALKQKLQAVSERSTKSEPITLADLEIFHIFGAWLDDAERATVKTLTEKVVASAVGAGGPRRRVSTKTSGGAPSSSASKSRGSKAKECDGAMSGIFD